MRTADTNTGSVRPDVIRTLVLEHSESLDLPADCRIVHVTAAPLTRQNATSTRMAGSVNVELSNAANGRAGTLKLWAKKVESPEVAFNAMCDLYHRLQKKGAHRPMPQPFFFDPRTGLIFMEEIHGRHLLPRVAVSSAWFRWAMFNGCRESFRSIGMWMAAFHAAAFVGKYVRLADMLPLLEDRVATQRDFSRSEKTELQLRLARLADDPLAQAELAVVLPHNDMTLRNILVDAREFHVVDWDAAVHPSFPQEHIGWWDFTTLLMNLESLMRFSPVVRPRRLSDLSEALWMGYAGEGSGIQMGLSQFRTSIMFVLVLRYYLGIDSDRPLHRIYSRRLGWRYARAIRSRLIAGSGSLFE